MGDIKTIVPDLTTEEAAAVAAARAAVGASFVPVGTKDGEKHPFNIQVPVQNEDGTVKRNAAGGIVFRTVKGIKDVPQVARQYPLALATMTTAGLVKVNPAVGEEGTPGHVPAMTKRSAGSLMGIRGRYANLG